MVKWKKQWSTLLKGDKLLFFGFNLLRFVSFCFVLFVFFSFVEDILKQYLKNENCHYHFPCSLINSIVGQYSYGLNSKELYMSFEIGSFTPWSHCDGNALGCYWNGKRRTRNGKRGMGKWKVGTKQRFWRVEVRFCSHFSFSRSSCLFLVLVKF